jgi:hypothetical protein
MARFVLSSKFDNYFGQVVKLPKKENPLTV